MLKSEVIPYYKKCCFELNNIYEYLQSLYTDDFVDELCRVRGYVDEDKRKLIKEMNLGYCDVDDSEEL